MKGRDEGVGKIANESDRIREYDVPGLPQKKSPGGRIKRRKQLVRRVGPRLGQRIEQRGFACIGVAHQGHSQHLTTFPRAAPYTTLAFQLGQPGLEQLHALAEQAAVGFQLFLTRATQTDAPLLTFKVGPALNQAGGKMLQLGQFDLQLALVALGTQRKDVEDQCGTVDYPTLQHTLQIPLLGSRNVMIENDNIGFVELGGDTDLVGLALSDVQRRIRGLPSTLDDTDDRGACAGCQQTDFRQALFDSALAEINLY